MYISDKITKEEIGKWKRGDDIFITAPTGSGKSHFVKHSLNSYCMTNGFRALLVVNRDNLKQQNIKDLGGMETNIVDVCSYQSLEKRVSCGGDFEQILKNYDIVVLDEIHYLLSDSGVNRYTDVLLKYYECGNYEKINIYMTATPEAVFMVRSNFNYVYDFPKTNSHISDIYFYRSDETLDRIMSSVGGGDKMLCFTSNQVNALSLAMVNPDVKFVCSKYSEFYKRSNSDELFNIINHDRFNCKILCTTKVLDNGINICDVKLKHIAIEMIDPIDFRQCLGRKRYQHENDKFVLYVKEYSKGHVRMFLENVLKKLQIVDELCFLGKDEFAKKYKKTMIDEVVDTDLTINRARHQLLLYQKDLYYKMLAHEHGYVGYILDLLEKDISEYKRAENFFEKTTIENVIENWVGVKMFKNEKIEFLKLLFSETLVKRKNGSDVKSVSAINNVLTSYDLPYEIINQRDWSKNKGGKTYWMVVRSESV